MNLTGIPYKQTSKKTVSGGGYRRSSCMRPILVYKLHLVAVWVNFYTPQSDCLCLSIKAPQADILKTVMPAGIVMALWTLLPMLTNATFVFVSIMGSFDFISHLRTFAFSVKRPWYIVCSPSLPWLKPGDDGPTEEFKYQIWKRRQTEVSLIWRNTIYQTNSLTFRSRKVDCRIWGHTWFE